MDIADHAEVFEPPVFDFKHPQSVAWMKGDKIRMLSDRTDRNVMPAEIILFQQSSKTFAESSFSGGRRLPSASNGIQKSSQCLRTSRMDFER